MKSVWAISAIAAVLIFGFIGVQDVYGPEEKPENLTLGGTGYNASEQAFEFKTLVKLPRGESHEGLTVFISVANFKPDGIPIRASASTDVPPSTLPAEGGQNSNLHKFVSKVQFAVTPELDGEKVLLEITAELIDPVKGTISGYRTIGDVTLKRG